MEQRDDTHRTEAEIRAELFERPRDSSIYMERYQRYTDMEAIPNDAIDLLDHVIVWPNGRLEASLKFLNKLPVPAGVELGTKVAE